MKAKEIKKILILEQGDPSGAQILSKAADVFGKNEPDYVILKSCRTHNISLSFMEELIRKEQPQLVLIGATSLGGEVAPALGARFGAGVAAHCIDFAENEEGEIAFIVPAFGGRAASEIFMPEANAEAPAIATVKPGIFPDPSEERFDALISGPSCRIIDLDALAEKSDPAEYAGNHGGFRMTERKPIERAAGSIDGADLILCGGYGLGSEENWNKLQTLAEGLGGACGCTRAALDAGWGCREDAMIGTSGKAVHPKVYIGFGISGAAHHTCGISGAEEIISINSDPDADIFKSSDHKGVFDAEKVMEALLKEIG